LEPRLLAAFVLGRISPEEAPLMARLTAWTAQVREPGLRFQLLDASLYRMRKEAPDMFLQMLEEWLRPERQRLWSDAIRAGISAIHDSHFGDLPALMAALQPVVTAAPAPLQLDLEELLVALYEVSPTEATFFIRQVLSEANDAQTAVAFRRMSPSFPSQLREDIHELVHGKPFSVT